MRSPTSINSPTRPESCSDTAQRARRHLRSDLTAVHLTQEKNCCLKVKSTTLGSTAVRTANVIMAFGTLVAIITGVAILAPHTWHDGAPDDRLLATMQQVVQDAQKALDETGDVPISLADLTRLLHPDQTGTLYLSVSYQRTGRTDIRLCGEFSAQGSGRTEVWPVSDIMVPLRSELSAPHPSGHHCYDVALEDTESAARQDALLLRELNSTATAVECTFTATSVLPRTIPKLDAASERQLKDPACMAPKFIARPDQIVEYAPKDSRSFLLCANFAKGYPSAEKPARVFDPMRDARFDALTRPRPQGGRHCYAITVLLPDPKTEVPASAWNETIDIDELPAETRGAARHDKRAIGDLVNILRLARCAFTMDGTSPSTIKQAMKTVSSRPGVAERYECDWVPSYYGEPKNFPVATYERIDDVRIRVCAHFRAAWAQPLALNYYPEAISTWPISLMEFQRPVLEPGKICLDVRLTPIGSGII